MSVTDRVRSVRPVPLGVAGPSLREMARDAGAVRGDPLTFLTDVSRRYGDLVSFPVPGLPTLLVGDAEGARHVLQTAGRGWTKQTVQYAALRQVTGPGLLASAEPSWLTHRRAAASAFHHQGLAAVSEQVTAAVDEAVRAELPAPCEPDRVVDVAALMSRIALDAVGRALFSADLTGHATELLQATSRSADLVVRLGRSMLPAIVWAPTPTRVRLRSTRRRLERITAEVIAERRSLGAAAPGGAAPGGAAGSYGDDLVGLLLASGMPDQQIHDELVTMVVAGHETVAGSLSWTLMLLAEHEEHQDRTYAELADLPTPVRLHDPRSRAPWTRAVLDEALRLYPPGWVLSRRAQHDDVVAGVPVPAGTLAIVSPWLIHRRADLWPDPEAFRPGRFLQEGAGRRGYLPFGLGARLCIGRDFALGEMAVVLARLLRTHRVGLTPGWCRPEPLPRLTVQPRGGMPLIVGARRDAP